MSLQSWLAPLVLFQLYLTSSVLLYFIGPWPWETENPEQLVTYLVAAQACIAIGYFFSRQATPSAPPDPDRAEKAAVRVHTTALWVTLLLSLPTSLSRSGSLIPNVLAGLANVGQAYNDNFERLSAGNAAVAVEYLRMFVSPLLVGLYPLTVVWWNKISVRNRILSVLAILFHLSVYIATGTNKALADFVVTIPWLLYLSLSKGNLRLRVPKLAVIVPLIALFVLFLNFFGEGQLLREGAVGEFGVLNFGETLLQTDQGNFLSEMLSTRYRIIYESLCRYVCSGYYALSMCFDIDHQSTLGFGNSMFAGRQANAILNTDFFTLGTLPGLLEEKSGWGMMTMWHSIYPWLASDFGFGGTLVVMSLFGFLLGLSWQKVHQADSPYWLVLLYLLLILFFYIPGNNQIFQSGETYFAFFLVLATLVFGRKPRP